MGKAGMVLIMMLLLAACQNTPPQVSIEGAKAEMSPAIVGEAIVSLKIVNQGGADVLTGVRTDLAGSTASFHLMQGPRMVTVDTMPVPARGILDLKLGGSQVLKGGSKSKPIRLGDGDHEISCKVDGIAVGLKACFVKKA